MLLVILVVAFPTLSTLIVLIWGVFLLVLLFCKYWVSGNTATPAYTDIHQFLAILSLHFEAEDQAFAEFDQYASVITTEPDQVCGICLDHIEINSAVADLPCQHAFHSSCFDKWFTMRPLCPVCKRDLSNK